MSTKPRKTCIKCGGDLPPPAPTGRPAAYCSPECKSSANYEARRVDRLLGKLETQMAELEACGLEEHIDGYTGKPIRDGGGRTRAQQRADLAAVIAKQERRLRELLAAGG